MTGPWITWREAWEAALYGDEGFYRTQLPADHFRTSATVSPVFADAILALLRREGLNAVTDVGAGSGELLCALHARDAQLTLAGVELRPRPATLPDDIAWNDTPPARLDGLVVVNELLDNVPCDVVELDRDGNVRIVEVQPSTLDERLGDGADDEVAEWLDRWWPLDEPGQRAEVGITREAWWADVCDRVGNGIALVIDYGHLRSQRPVDGTLTSYRTGRQTALSLDGSHDVTAHVAVDALAAAVHGTLETQRDALRELGISGARPPLTLASIDPKAYVEELSAAGEAAELIEPSGLGGFWWVLARHLSSSPWRQTPNACHQETGTSLTSRSWTSNASARR